MKKDKDPAQELHVSKEALQPAPAARPMDGAQDLMSQETASSLQDAEELLEDVRDQESKEYTPSDDSKPFGEFTDYYRDMARKENGEFSECDICQKTIKYGNAISRLTETTALPYFMVF